MKSVYVDNILHQKLKKLAQENGQTLLSLLNTFVQEGIERMEKNRYHPRLAVLDVVGPDIVGMFGTTGKQQKDIETIYGEDRYQGVGEADGRF